MKLIAAPVSPYSRKVRIVLAEKRMEYDLVLDSPMDSATRVPDFNPLGKVPVLVLDDDTTLFDSRVIVEYLDSASPVGRLIPDDTRQRLQTRRWEALADGCTDAAIACVLEQRRPSAQQSAESIARQRGKVDRALGAMADELAGRTWCMGDSLTLAASPWVVRSAIWNCACLNATGARSIRMWRRYTRSSQSARRSSRRCRRNRRSED